MIKAIFLDRDGTINMDHGYVHRIEDWAYTHRAVEALKLFARAGYSLIVVTNQSGIAYGLYTKQDMEDLHAIVQVDLLDEGIGTDFFYCPHEREGDCDCRKPKIGMAKQAEEMLGSIDYANSWMIGDKPTDVKFGKNCGMRTVILKSKYWGETDADFIANNLFEAFKIIRDEDFKKQEEDEEQEVLC